MLFIKALWDTLLIILLYASGTVMLHSIEWRWTSYLLFGFGIVINFLACYLANENTEIKRKLLRTK